MSNQHTVTINGVHYDPHSGLPVSSASANTTHVETAAKLARTVGGHAGKMHAKTHRSHTLNRDFVQQPATRKSRPAPEANSHQANKISAPQAAPMQTRSPHISKFQQHVKHIPSSHKPSVMSDIGPARHKSVVKANQHIAHKAHVTHAPVQAKPAQEIKQQAITHAMHTAAASHAQDTKQRKRGYSKSLNVASASLAVVLLAGYFTYINMPTLSVRIAAAQAGIDASYPQYRPSGYSLNGPVAYKNGQVSMQFAANAGPQEFSLNQSRSTWDSSALLANYIEPQSKGEYATYNDSGLTVYTYGNNAAWVNGGILHTLEGSAPLSNDQIRHIATSM